MERLWITGILLVSFLGFISCANPTVCETKKSCDSCIGTAGCAWCKANFFSQRERRCNTVAGLTADKCPAADIVKAEKGVPQITKREPISKSMRIAPQEVNVRLAIEQEVSINLTYNDSTDKPLDLYYIMDLSATMEDDKNTVSEQAENLVRELQKITKDVRLGFGSFIDKPVLPFVAASQLRPDPKYDIPYGFKNWLKLTHNTAEFRSVVRDARISRNLDEPEGTLDALMQAIKCTDEIGWRNESRKLIVVATDGNFHIAGDGKLGGIVIPNDMKCHMENNQYTHSTILDYPSIGEINAVILDHKVYVIFAVSSSPGNDVFNAYNDLQKHITQSTAEQLKGDSSNVVQTIKQKYLEISKRVELSVAEKPDHVDVTIFAKCSPGQKARQMYCSDVGVGSKIEFEIILKLTKCPDLQSTRRNDEVVISFFELTDREKLKIKLSYECSCSCNQQKNQNDTDLQAHCNGKEAANHISCGMCTCKQGRYGSSCQCSDNGNNEENTNCINLNKTDTYPCSNRGDCKCGQCECHVGFNGKYCEDSTFDCRDKNSPSDPDRLCSGPDKGQCVKGKCQCHQRYEGKHCECEKSRKDFCIEPGKPLTSADCNGHGFCDCPQAQCKCDSGYGGLYCGVCKVNCPSGEEKSESRCQDEFLQKCVRCNVQNRLSPDKKLDLECAEICDFRKYKGKETSTSTRADVSSIEVLEKPSIASLSEVDGTECRLKINSTPCYTVFKYAYQRTSVRALDILQLYYTADGVTCAKDPPFLWYIFGVILSVLLAGIFALLIWKLATHFHDTREFQRFQKETQSTRWGKGENPLYEEPMRDYANPAYRQ